MYYAKIKMYYAVHRGKKTGIFSSWEECKKSVGKYPDASYKKFKNIDNAREFVVNGSIKSNTEEKIEVIPNQQIIKVYTDGSCIQNINNRLSIIWWCLCI